MTTRESGDIRLLVLGSSSGCADFLESVRNAPGIAVVGLVDTAPDPDGLALAREMGVPLCRRLTDFSHDDAVDAVVDFTGCEEAAREARRRFSGRAPVLGGQGSRLVARLAGLYGRQSGYEERFRAVKREMEAYLDRGERMIGRSRQTEEVRDLIERVAATPTTVLLLGETGTGKDLAARSIHAASHLRDKPFITVNCTALTATLIESELFGYRKGAFTGAEGDRKGLLEEADGGALFLDEIGDMHLELQAKMLRFLQTGEVRRVGSVQARHVDVRVIAATNRDLERAVAAGDFRRDLYYRFNTFTIRLAPLRERVQDIPYLAFHFLTKAEAKLNKKVDGISDEALGLLTAYDWPGNVRELANVIERAVILCRGDRIVREDLPRGLGVPCPDASGPATGGAIPAGGVEEPDEADFSGQRERIMANFERKELLYYMKKADGNISQASRLSGIPRRTFYRKLRKYGL
ncbi:MAG: sigma-54 interaction domain-containing protein [Thermodesulfobacteriota bacterium]